MAEVRSKAVLPERDTEAAGADTEAAERDTEAAERDTEALEAEQQPAVVMPRRTVNNAGTVDRC
jgi:hypothetical protein